jgi:aspartate aminotransferase
MNGSVSRSIALQMERSSWIRRMFEIGIQLRKERGAENVFDFSLGNPEVEATGRGFGCAAAGGLGVAPARSRLHAQRRIPGSARRHRAQSRGAHRSAIQRARHPHDQRRRWGDQHVLKAVLDPGDEVIVLSPYFPEYRFYIENHGGRMVTVETDEHFQPDIDAIAAAITPRTKALI